MIYFLFEGEQLPVTNMFDVDGEETSDCAEAITIVAILPNGQWLTAVVLDGELTNGKPPH